MVWIKKKSYAQAKPTKDDMLLLCEVADSTLDYELGRKAAIYALGGIQEYWVIVIPRRRIHMHTNPTSDGSERRFSDTFGHSTCRPSDRDCGRSDLRSALSP